MMKKRGEPKWLLDQRIPDLEKSWNLKKGQNHGKLVNVVAHRSWKMMQLQDPLDRV